MDITSLRAAQNDTSISPVGRSSVGIGGIGKDGASAVASLNTSVSSGNRHIHHRDHAGIFKI